MKIDVTKLSEQARNVLATVLVQFGCVATKDHAFELLDQDRDLRQAHESLTLSFHRYKAQLASNYTEEQYETLQAICEFMPTEEPRYMQLLSKWHDGSLRKRDSGEFNTKFFHYSDTGLRCSLYWSDKHKLLMPIYSPSRPENVCHEIYGRPKVPAAVAE